MAFKEWFQKLRPMQVYIMLVLTGVFFTVELIISHFTHSLTLLVDSYHMLCNIITLTGCIITIKKLHPQEREEVCSREPQSKCSGDVVEHIKTENREVRLEDNWVTGGIVFSRRQFQKTITDKISATVPEYYNNTVTKTVNQSESSLKNTFGWARIDILVMLIGCIFLASLCFSVLVEAVQTLIHIDHHDEMHFPLVVLMVAAAGLLLNGFCYSLIGGYTFHQGSYLHVTENGEVVLERTVTIDSLRKGQRRLSSQSRRTAPPPPPPHTPSQRQGSREMIRDIIGCLHVIACGLVVYFMTGHQFAKYLDPIISLMSATSLLILSYPYMKESGLILLQTIPDDINIDSLRSELLRAFPDIVNVHDLHVWQLTANKIFSTAHIIFLNPSDYLRIDKEMTKFFNDQGITQVTIQAEFVPETESNDQRLEILAKSHLKPCLMQCMTEECRRRHCCVRKEEPNDREDLEVIKIEGPTTVSSTVNESPGQVSDLPEQSSSKLPPEEPKTIAQDNA